MATLQVNNRNSITNSKHVSMCAGLTDIPAELLLHILDSILEGHRCLYSPEPQQVAKSKAELRSLGSASQATYYPYVWRDVAHLAGACRGFNALIIPILYRVNIEHDGSSGLFLSARKGHTGAVRKFLEYGADPDAEDSILLRACISKSNIQSPENSNDLIGMTALHWASLFGHEEVVSLLLMNGASVNARSSTLGQCVLDNHPLSECRALKSANDWFHPTSYGANALFFTLADDTWKSSFSKCPDSKSEEHDSTAFSRLMIARRLIRSGSPLITHKGARLHALHQATAYGNVEAVKLLLSLDVDPNVRDGQGNTPLHHMASLYTNSAEDIFKTRNAESRILEIMEILQTYGAGIDSVNHRGSTPLYHCLSIPGNPIIYVATSLIRSGAKIQNGISEYHRSRFSKHQLEKLYEAGKEAYRNTGKGQGQDGFEFRNVE